VKVKRTKTEMDAKGYMVTCDYSSYDEVDASTVKKPAKLKASQPTAAAKTGGLKKALPGGASTAGTGNKKVQQGLGAFFAKK